MRKKLFAYVVSALVAAGIAVVALPPGAAQAHGAMMVPGSRTWLCYKDGRNPNTGAIEPRNAACAAAVAQSGTTSLYNWFAVLRSDGAGRMSGFIPDGQLCSGGTGGPYNFSGFNLARNDWPLTHLTTGASLGVRYNNWAKHPGTFRLYITKDSWSPTRSLAWSDLESTPFDSVTNPPDNGGPGSDDGYYYWNARLPSGKSGRHLIYSVWQRSDSNETFYGCSDVVFDGGNGEVTGVGNGSTQPPPSDPPPSSPPPSGGGACTAMFNTTGSWNGGFQGEVMVHAGDTAISNWTVSWTWPGSQGLAQVWNGTASTTGSLISVKNVNWNGTVAAGKYVTFGLLGSGTAPPSVNNLACTTT
ncbi:lytic polysaccharide monooxygenase auxiliary activity family 9 protein [Actinoplanes solisilvae]|uniref:lytic polysaccharide monooxygenase auxiliary activity family 9 protein n=1 Tax=Actinoplanes solisilvae TaxID=2486853 RepID=UPI003D7AA0F9